MGVFSAHRVPHLGLDKILEPHYTNNAIFISIVFHANQSNSTNTTVSAAKPSNMSEESEIENLFLQRRNTFKE